MTKQDRHIDHNRVIRILNRIVDAAVLLLLLICLMLAIWSFWDSHQVYEEASVEQYTAYKPIPGEETKSFDELRAMNSDVIGWLTIYDTKIDYPLVQSKKNNSEYLSRDPEGEFQSSGSIYLDYRNNQHFKDFNTIIQGHHMDERKMFGDLELFVDKSFFDKHRYGTIFYDGKNHGIEFFAVLKVDAHTGLIQNPGITNKSEQQEYLDTIYDRALFTRGIGVTTEDHIVALSTCAMDMTNGRFILFAKLYDYEIKNPFPEEIKGERLGNGIDVFRLFNKASLLPLWQLDLLLLLIILFLYLLSRLEHQRWQKKKGQKKK